MKRFCSESHYNRHWRERNGRVGTPRTAVCLYGPCDVKFTTTQSTRLFCSRDHKYRHRYATRDVGAENARALDYIRSNPGLRQRSRERAAQWKRDNPDRMREHFRRSTLLRRGLTPEGYDALSEEFEGACWICRKLPTERSKSGNGVRNLAVDHDHSLEQHDPGAVRGLLDTWCNTRLAIVEDWHLVQRIERFLTRGETRLPPTVPGATRHQRLWGKFGLTVEQYEQMVRDCGDRCEVCGHPERPYKSGRPRVLSVEHDHAKTKGEPGFIRGLACNACNSAIGVYENREWWDAAVAYLEWAPPLAQQLTAGHRPTKLYRPRAAA